MLLKEMVVWLHHLLLRLLATLLSSLFSWLYWWTDAGDLAEPGCRRQ